MSQWLSLAQLVRLPNLFTAWADILLAALAAGALPQQVGPFLLLLLSSSCLYCSGMVWNDYFDLEQDQRERPERPLPSGRISLSTAFLLAIGLMLAGVVLAVLADLGEAGLRWHSTIIAGLLCVAILSYDGWLKRTPFGPVGMGLCRFLNILLGLSVAPGFVGEWGVVLALVVGTYIAGVTWFARTEAVESSQPQLRGAAGVMLAGVLLALVLPAVVPVDRDLETNLPTSQLIWWGQLLFPWLLAGFILWLALPLSRALGNPIPTLVQRAVKASILGLVVLDAVLAALFVGPLGLLLGLLLIPARILGRWIYST